MRLNSDDPLDPRLRAGLEQLKPMPLRNPEAAHKGRTQFLLQARELHPPVSRTPWQRLIGWFTKPQKDESPMPTSLRRRLLLLLLTLALVVGSAGFLVSTAQASLPGQSLYPVKMMSEEVRLGLTVGPRSQIEYLLALTDRRLREIKALVARGQPVPASLTARLGQHWQQVLSLAAGLKNDADLNQVLTQVQPVLQAQAETVVGLQTDDEQLAQLHDALSAQLELTEVGLTDTAAFRAIVREPEATATLEPTHPPEATATTEPTHPPEASRTPEPTHPPEATNTQVPEPTRTPTSPPEASRTPTPGETLEPTQPPEFTNTPTTTPTTGL